MRKSVKRMRIKRALRLIDSLAIKAVMHSPAASKGSDIDPLRKQYDALKKQLAYLNKV